METYQALILGSGHHAHLKQEDLEILFGPGAELTPKRQFERRPPAADFCPTRRSR